MSKTPFSFILALALTTLFTLTGCSMIEPFEIVVEDPNTLGKIKTLKQVDIENVGNFGYSGPCTRDEAMNTDYRILSSGTYITDNYAMWICVNWIVKDKDCPSLSVHYLRDNIIKISVLGRPENAHKQTSISCALAAIDLAPTKRRPTSEAVKNRDSWKE